MTDRETVSAALAQATACHVATNNNAAAINTLDDRITALEGMLSEALDLIATMLSRGK